MKLDEQVATSFIQLLMKLDVEFSHESIIKELEENIQIYKDLVINGGM